MLRFKHLSEGFGQVYLLYALARKYPHAEREWCWQYVFPSAHRSIDPRHESIETTQIYTHVMRRPGIGVRSPLDL